LPPSAASNERATRLPSPFTRPDTLRLLLVNARARLDHPAHRDDTSPLWETWACWARS